jgi:quinoprotein glucose dehydrogenase
MISASARALALLAPLLAGLLSAQTLQLEEAERLPTPDVAEASDDARQAISRFQVPPDLQVSLWAAEPMLANPVAIAFDELGRLFVSETYRYRSSVLDIRSYMGMLEQDLALRTVEDRRRMIQDVFGPEQAAQLAIETEVVRLVEDRDGDGVADHSTIFADGFNSALDGIASGVIARRGQVWFTNIPSLWLLEGEGDRPTVATRRQEILTGFGVRFGYTGHDFHGLAFGPDGKLYYSIGDRGTHVVTPEGRTIALPDTGAVFRSQPDGSEMEVVATGLRNPQELVFDEYGNLFTGDNDCDNGDLERLVYVVEGGDSGWRVGYQHAPLGKAGPWMRELLWLPRFPDQAAYLLPPVCNIEDGPSGLTYYPGTGLTPAYRGTFFITHFKGSIARSGVQAYQIRPDGATFTPTASSLFLGGLLPTDVTFGPDGRFYVSDWVEGWPKSRKGRIYAVAPKHEDPASAQAREAMRQLWAEGLSGRSLPELVKLLAHADQRIRLEAQFELADRGQASVAPLQTLAQDRAAAQLARLHAIWGLGQISRAVPSALAVWAPLLADPDAEVRAQIAKILGDRQVAAAYDALLGRLQDDAARVRFFAAQSLGKLGRPEAGPALVEYLRRNDDRDAYERHAAVHALERLRATDALAAAARDTSRAVRLGALLVYRRLGDASAGGFLRDPDPFIVREAARAVNDEGITGAFAALAARLSDAPLEDEPLMLRVLNAHFRLGRPEHATQLADWATRPDVPAALRVEALTHLAQWGQPPARDRLVGVFRPLEARDAAPAVAALQPLVPTLLQSGSLPVQRQTLAAIESLALRAAGPEIRRLALQVSASPTLRAEALRVLDALNDPELLATAKRVSEAEAPAVRLAALPILARLSAREALPVIDRLLTEGTPAEQQGALRALGRLDLPETATLLTRALTRLSAGAIAPAAQFELLEVAERSTVPAVQAQVGQIKQRWAESGDALAPFRGALAGGNRQRGSNVFYDHPVMACVRCHQVWGSGGDAGPDLTTVGKLRSPDYLLESIIKPSAHISPGFDVISVTLTDGSLEAGTVVSETAETLVLRRADGTEVSLAAAQVKARESAPSSMPEIYAHVLSRTELRDLMAFLVSLNSDAEPEINDGPRALRTGFPDEPGRGDEATLEEETSEPAGGETGGTATAPAPPEL